MACNLKVFHDDDSDDDGDTFSCHNHLGFFFFCFQLHDVCPDDVMVAVPQEAIYIAMNTLNENLKRWMTLLLS